MEPQTPKTEPNLSALCNELTSQIAGYLTLQDLLSLRRTSRNTSAICSQILRSPKQTLYLHPLRLQDAIKICGVDEFRNSISEIVLLGKSTQTLRPLDFSSGFDNYHPWPLFDDTSGLELFYSENVATYSEQHRWRRWMSANYTSLFGALDRLPALEKLTYASNCLQAGFCSSSQMTIDAHAREIDRWPRFDRDSGVMIDDYDDDLSHNQHDFLRFWTDSELLMGILASGCASFTTITLHQSMPDRPTVRWAMLHNRWLPKYNNGSVAKRVHECDTFRDGQMDLDYLTDDDYREATVEIGHGVTRLEVALPNGDVSRADLEWATLFHEFAARLPDIEHLEVRIDTVVDQHHRMLVAGTHDTERQAHFQTVHMLNFSSFFYYFSNIGDLRFRHLTKLRWYSPSTLPCCHDSPNTRSFLEAHKTSLREVTFHNIFFAESEGGDESGIRSGMREVIQALSEIDHLESVSLYVPRLEDAHLDDTQSAGTDYAYKKCYQSADSDFYAEWFNVKVFDKLAEELRIPLEDEGWNFAKHLNPPEQLDPSPST